MKAHRLVYHSTLGSRVIKKKKSVQRIVIELEVDGRRTVNLRRTERAQNEGSTGPKRLDDTRYKPHKRGRPALPRVRQLFTAARLCEW